MSRKQKVEGKGRAPVPHPFALRSKDPTTWRETAARMLPELAASIAAVDTPYLMWFDIRSAFERAYDADPPDESLIRRIYAFCDWCVDAPQGATAQDDLFTCVAGCFLEHIAEHPKARADMPRWFTLEDVQQAKQIFSHHIGERSFAALEAEFRAKGRGFASAKSAKSASRSPRGPAAPAAPGRRPSRR